MNAPSDEQLVAYLDDELDREQRSQLDALIADDPLLSLRVQWLRPGFCGDGAASSRACKRSSGACCASSS